MMWTFVFVKTAFHHASHILPMEINKLCVIPAGIWISLAFGGGCGNENVHYLIDLIFPPFGRPTVICEMLAIFFHGDRLV